ncbi:MAG TPA: dihydroorotate dehydrogenase 2 [Actinomycetota bacterium]|nr:dihydroorotate dehydrogenase 2 [Actinomycetota bacterium]
MVRRDGEGAGRGRGWYGTVARPLLFALPPEASHTLAGALLRLPLPWERLGGSRRDPSLEVELCGIRLPNPIGLAAGFDKTCRHLDALGRVGFGFVVGGTITRRPRRGNRKPRIVRDRPRLAIVNSMGLPNPGAEAAARALARGRRTAPRFASVADERLDDAVACVELLAPHVDGIELNASSPNAPWRHDPGHLTALLSAFRERTERPVLLKLPPFRSDEERDEVLRLARAAVDAGAQGLVCSNTVAVEEPRLATRRGGLSGGPLTSLTPRIVARVAAATGRSVPIVACGGIAAPADVRACLDAGATAVQLYTGLIYRGPAIVGELTEGLVRAGRPRS